MFTRRGTCFFEPSLDVLVREVPRWGIAKFGGASHRIGSEIKIVGEVATLATRARSVRETVRVGLAWGVGHALPLFAAAGAVHAGANGHGEAEHAHAHPTGLPRRAALVGLMHGLAGSAALLLIGAGTMETAGWALGYVALFGLGSILGMAALSATIALPLKLSAGLITWGYNGVHAAVGAATIVLGTLVLAETAAPAAALIGLA